MSYLSTFRYTRIIRHTFSNLSMRRYCPVFTAIICVMIVRVQFFLFFFFFLFVSFILFLPIDLFLIEEYASGARRYRNVFRINIPIVIRSQVNPEDEIDERIVIRRQTHRAHRRRKFRSACVSALPDAFIFAGPAQHVRVCHAVCTGRASCNNFRPWATRVALI